MHTHTSRLILVKGHQYTNTLVTKRTHSDHILLFVNTKKPRSSLREMADSTPETG